jgi:hypothetical protein
VELSTDDGKTWTQEAEVEALSDDHAWVRWKARLDLAPGTYDVRARSWAGDAVQPGEAAAPHPSGSQGYDLRIVKIG